MHIDINKYTWRPASIAHTLHCFHKKEASRFFTIILANLKLHL